MFKYHAFVSEPNLLLRMSGTYPHCLPSLGCLLKALILLVTLSPLAGGVVGEHCDFVERRGSYKSGAEC